MNTTNIYNKLIELGESPVDINTGTTEEGPVLGLHIGNGQAIWGVIPIDDESDERFAEYMHNEAVKEREKRGNKENIKQ